jgi:SAM-dependent methyltransferase
MKAKQSPLGRAPKTDAAARPEAGAGLVARIPALVEAWRGEGGRSSGERLGRREIEEAGSTLLSLQRGLTGNRRLAGERYMERRDLLGAYLLYYWPVSYMQASLALAEHPFAPRRVLDLGSGPGPLSAALLDLLEERGEPPPEELVLVDASRKALGLAASIISRGAVRPGRLSSFELDLETAAELPAGSFDLILMGHCLNELWPGGSEAMDSKRALLERAARSLAPGGRILLIEPALLATCRDLIALRDRLAAEGWSVLGPCPGSYPCPVLAAGPERSCHAESPWAPPEPVASLALAAGLDRSSVKWTHFLLAPESGPESRRPLEAGASPAALLHRGAGGRIVSDPMLNKAGRLRYIVCGAGALAALSARADDGAVRSSGFMDLRRGDFIRAEGIEERPGGGLGLGPGSRLDVVSRAPEAAS